MAEGILMNLHQQPPNFPQTQHNSGAARFINGNAKIITHLT
jgi:hypothetical protein